MKKTILLLTIIASLMTLSLVQAKNDDIKPNTANVLKSDLKQRIQIEETSAGNLAWITGAKITEILTTVTPGLIKVKVFGQDYKIEVATTTNVVRQHWGKAVMGLSEFSVGDIVNAYGNLDSTDYFLIHAKNLRNVSIQKLHAVVEGEVSSVSSSTNSFVISVKKDGTNTVTINTDANTQISSRNNLKTFSDIQVGMKVVVRGIWDKTLSKIQALIVKIKSADTETKEDD